MRWYKQLYYGDLSPRKCKRIRFCIKHNVLLINAYIISLALSDSEQLDLIPARELVQKSYPKKNLAIIGIAKDYHDALAVVEQIVKDVLKADPTINIRQYFSDTEDKKWVS